MKSAYPIIFVFSLVAARINAQPISAVPENLRALNTFEQLTYNGGFNRSEKIYGIPFSDVGVLGDVYLNSNWKRSAILLNDGDKQLKNYEVKYDIMADALIIRTVAGLRSLAGRNVKSFTWVDSATSKPVYFINANAYKLDDAPLIGFFEVVSDGKMPLLKRTTLAIKKADYNVALAVGSRNDKILKRPELYYAVGDNVFVVPNSKKKLLSAFQQHSNEINSFCEQRKLSVKKEEDLKAIFNHYNELIR